MWGFEHDGTQGERSVWGDMVVGNNGLPDVGGSGPSPGKRVLGEGALGGREGRKCGLGEEATAGHRCATHLAGVGSRLHPRWAPVTVLSPT